MMNKASSKVLKSIFLTSILSLFHSSGGDAKEVLGNNDGLEFDNKSALKSFRPKTTKDVLKISTTGDARYVAQHRSHSSHRSHRSHSSHRSGSSHYSSSHYSSTQNSSTRSKSSRSSTNSSGFISAPVAPKVYSLGERTISQGMTGADVANLADLLVKNLYLNKADVIQKNGKTVYNDKVRNAIILFQKDANLTTTGNADAITVECLKTWHSSKSTVVLGVRELTVGMSGTDVTELIRLLTKAGYAPDPSKLETVDGASKMTDDIVMALKMFQAYSKLSMTGRLDSMTLARLKTAAQ